MSCLSGGKNRTMRSGGREGGTQEGKE